MAQLNPDSGDKEKVFTFDDLQGQTRDRSGRFASDPDSQRPPPTRDEMRTVEQCRAFARKMLTQLEHGARKPLARELCMPLSRFRGISSGFTFLEEMERRRISRIACLYDRGEVWPERVNTHLTPQQCWLQNKPSHVWKYALGCDSKSRGKNWPVDAQLADAQGSLGCLSLNDREK
jgi:hypothetical protein